MVTSSKFDHVTPLLKDLHWLAIAERIKFKIPLLTFKGLHDLSPSYIKDLLTPYCPAHMFHFLPAMVIRLSPYPPLSFGISYLMTLRSRDNLKLKKYFLYRFQVLVLILIFIFYNRVNIV